MSNEARLVLARAKTWGWLTLNKATWMMRVVSRPVESSFGEWVLPKGLAFLKTCSSIFFDVFDVNPVSIQRSTTSQQIQLLSSVQIRAKHELSLQGGHKQSWLAQQGQLGCLRLRWLVKTSGNPGAINPNVLDNGKEFRWLSLETFWRRWLKKDRPPLLELSGMPWPSWSVTVHLSFDSGLTWSEKWMVSQSRCLLLCDFWIKCRSAVAHLCAGHWLLSSADVIWDSKPSSPAVKGGTFSLELPYLWWTSVSTGWWSLIFVVIWFVSFASYLSFRSAARADSSWLLTHCPDSSK